MKHLSLASRYRPQTFAEVTGQHLAATALSRASAADRVAPAYLLSGTRGVGKTTIARIFAKALNCEHAPVPEPCNECASCRHIIAGNHVDVSEIDGASNTGVDDVRALRENIGYMPMEGRYKIFIVDEAHMLSKNAFNALLKTLEEPPPHTVFIFATTEAHRFPATIISRCQHYVFRHLPEELIYGHLVKILEKEKMAFEPGAVRLVAKRAAGSVRDSLSLLDQVLALADGGIAEAAAREALGVAGQELFSELFDGLAARDCGAVLTLCRQLLGTGVDIGFFIRELAANLRNLFLHRQSGDRILSSLNVSPDDTAFIKKHAPRFTAAHLHAAWQMVLDAQRNIARSPEPGAGLELLLINLALLPQLVPVGSMGGPAEVPGPSANPEGAGNSAPHLSSASANPVYPEKSENRSRWHLEEQPSGAAPGLSDLHDGNLGEAYSPDWKGFCNFCLKEHENGIETVPGDILRFLQVEWKGQSLAITAPNMILWSRLEKKRPLFLEALNRYCRGHAPQVGFNAPETPPPREDGFAQCAQLPEIELCREILGATIAECRQKPR